MTKIANNLDDDIIYSIWKMDKSELLPIKDLVIDLLDNRSMEVRLDAVRALHRIGSSTVTLLRKQARKERNEFVLAEIVDTLGSFGDQRSGEFLKKLAARHKSGIVRSYAALAVGDILGDQADEFLLKRLESDSSRRVRAAISAYLAGWDSRKAVPFLEKYLRSKDPLVRSIVANTLKSSSPVVNRELLIELLSAASQRESVPGIREEIESVIEEFKALDPPIPSPAGSVVD